MMIFEELKKKDYYGAFSNWMTIKDAKEENVIPKEFHDLFNEHCVCGSERIITDTGSRYMCCDPRCYVKLGYALYKIMSSFSVVGIGEETCTSIMRYYKLNDMLKYDTPLEALVKNMTEYPGFIGPARANSFMSGCLKIFSTPLTFPAMMSRVAIPNFDTICMDVFSGINSSDELLELINKKGGLGSFLESRGVHDPMKKFYLKEYLRDIPYAEKVIFNKLRVEGKQVVKVCMSGKIVHKGVKYTKSEFIGKLNALSVISTGVQVYEFQLCSAINSVSYLITDDPTHSKSNIARAREMESTIKLPVDESGNLTTMDYTCTNSDFKVVGYEVDANGNRYKVKRRKILYSSEEFCNMLENIIKSINEEVEICQATK